MTAFVIVLLAAILLLLALWFWLRLRRQNQPQGDSFAGKSTIAELIAKERRKK
jgi:hypothetical protein